MALDVFPYSIDEDVGRGVNFLFFGNFFAPLFGAAAPLLDLIMGQLDDFLGQILAHVLRHGV